MDRSLFCFCFSLLFNSPYFCNFEVYVINCDCSAQILIRITFVINYLVVNNSLFYNALYNSFEFLCFTHNIYKYIYMSRYGYYGTKYVALDFFFLPQRIYNTRFTGSHSESTMKLQTNSLLTMLSVSYLVQH